MILWYLVLSIYYIIYIMLACVCVCVCSKSPEKWHSLVLLLVFSAENDMARGEKSIN